MTSVLAWFLLVAAAAVLIYAAIEDLRHRKIANPLIVLLGALYVAYVLVAGRWTTAYWNVGFAVLMFAIMLMFYMRNWMGGGDVKLLAVAFLWTGIDCALGFAVLLALFAGIHAAVAAVGWVTAPAGPDGRSRIAFAPAIAAALIGTFLLGCLQ